MVVTARVVVGTPTSPTPKNGKRFLFEFLSFKEFKFVKIWEDWDADMMMMPPAGACAARRAAADLFGDMHNA